ncbi:hypothetical protein [Cellulosimicrobium sp. Marseille-Q4280]|uniref:hypothetical protein n=1 Tax=Cellulosimicrobium sp. Marseille-Q4280 TaxID=2937992 RepID=UPI0020400D88|nr:hypothetical protein [Cellulosimicrobium sp. Marseille-Q4280]
MGAPVTAPITSEQATETIWRLAPPTGVRIERVAQQILDLDEDAAEAAYRAAVDVDPAAAHRIADQLEAEQQHGGRLHELVHFAHPSEHDMGELREAFPGTMRTASAMTIAGLVLLPLNWIGALVLSSFAALMFGVSAAAALIACGFCLMTFSIGGVRRERQAAASAYMISLEMALLAVATHERIGTGGYTREHFDTLMGPWSRGVHPIHIG